MKPKHYVIIAVGLFLFAILAQEVLFRPRDTTEERLAKWKAAQIERAGVPVEQVLGDQPARTFRVEPPKDGSISSAVVSPDGRVVSYCEAFDRAEADPGNYSPSTEYRTAVFFDLETGTELHRHSAPGMETWPVREFSPDSRLAVLSQRAGETWTVHVIDVRTGNEVSQLREPALSGSLQFSEDSRLLASMKSTHNSWPHYDSVSRLHIWDASTGKRFEPFGVLLGYQSAYAFAGDGKTLALASVLKLGLPEPSWYKVHVWDVVTGRNLGQLRPQTKPTTTTTVQEQLKDVGAVAGFRVRRSPSGELRLFPPFPTRFLDNRPPDRRYDALGGSASLFNLLTDKAIVELPRYSNTSYLRHLLSADGNRIVSICSSHEMQRSAALEVSIWDVSRLNREAGASVDQRPRAELEALWQELGRPEVPRAHRAMCQLTRSPQPTLAFLTERLDAGVAMNPSETGRLLWTIELLEHLATPEAKQLLERLAQSSADAWVKLEAKASLQRLGSSK